MTDAKPRFGKTFFAKPRFGKPRFWQSRGIISTLLMPLAGVWLIASAIRRSVIKPAKSPLPVVCIGNITSGGTGKTPLVSALAEAALERGWRPVILMRGHGGTAAGPLLIDAHTDAATAGDEALWHNETCPVVISRNRAAGAHFITEHDCGDLIIMDDGMQNPGLIKDSLVVVFNGSKGVENGRIIPAGPLRESLAAGLKRAQVAAITGDDATGLEALIRRLNPALMVATIPRHLHEGDIAAIADTPVVAFAGIGDNDAFFAMLAEAGVQATQHIGFADHHAYSADDIAFLKGRARDRGASLVTTTKDMMRLKGRADAGGIRAIRLMTTLPPSLVEQILPPR